MRARTAKSLKDRASVIVRENGEWSRAYVLGDVAYTHPKRVNEPGNVFGWATSLQVYVPVQSEKFGFVVCNHMNVRLEA